ncbi:MAG: GIY-YIG nuclease family protein [Vicinamibacteria bacterium]
MPRGPRIGRRPRAVAFVYILRCRDGSFYTGATKDLDARLRLHQAGRASRYTRAHLPVALVWSIGCATWSQALREEHRIKQLGRRGKEALVSGRRRRAAPR